MPIREGEVITRETAERWLRKEADTCATAVAERYPLLNENQAAAITSLCFNAGVDCIGETLAAALKSGDWQKAGDTLLEYHHADGHDVEGLKNRRKAERKIFDAPVASAPVAVDEQVAWLKIYPLVIGGQPLIGVAANRDATTLATWTGTDRKALVQFLSRFPNANNVHFAQPTEAWPGEYKPDPVVVEKYLKLQRTGTKEDKGCEILLLTLEGTNKSWYCRSGQPQVQVFENGGSQNVPGSMYPLPAGEYSVENIQWQEKDNYAASLGQGLGPLFVPVEPKFKTKRGSFGVHLDCGAYGTAGCIGLRNEADLRDFVAALREHDPKRLQVAWGL